ALDLGEGYLLLRAWERSLHHIDGLQGQVITNYIRQADEALGNNVPANWCVKLARWARLRLPTGQTARSAWKETLKPFTDVRRSRCVKLQLHDQIELAEVKFYFNVHINSCSKAFALVLLYSRPDETLLDASMKTVYSVTLLEEETGLHVVSAKSILAVVSIQPHNHPEYPEQQRYFVWAKLGLDMAGMRDAEEPLVGND
ncbi:hypothetical protein JB92DRAFT_2706119, partial [Gautieria morchelliformis]